MLSWKKNSLMDSNSLDNCLTMFDKRYNNEMKELLSISHRNVFVLLKSNDFYKYRILLFHSTFEVDPIIIDILQSIREQMNNLDKYHLEHEYQIMRQFECHSFHQNISELIHIRWVLILFNTTQKTVLFNEENPRCELTREKNSLQIAFFSTLIS